MIKYKHGKSVKVLKVNISCYYRVYHAINWRI